MEGTKRKGVRKRRESKGNVYQKEAGLPGETPGGVVGDSQTQKEVFYCRRELLRRTLDWKTLEDTTDRNQQNLSRSGDAS